LKGRELEQAVIATFLHSQPQGNSAHRRELILLSAATRPDKIEFEKALHRWAQTSHWLDDRNTPEEAGHCRALAPWDATKPESDACGTAAEPGRSLILPVSSRMCVTISRSRPARGGGRECPQSSG
jgi:hypothetical protein